MSRIKSYSVGNGDMFYIEHGSDNFTIIDCCISDEDRYKVLNEISHLSAQKGITRFISTHPDEDHIQGLEYLDDKIGILNFYCVKNNATKEDESESFRRYRKLHDSTKAFYIHEGCSRYWMNLSNDERDTSGINLLWPDIQNNDFKDALQSASEGNSPNNISPIIKYSLKNGVTALWMGDLETDFMDAIKSNLLLPNVDILFAPHHGRASGKVPQKMLNELVPKIVVIGEAPSGDLNYYKGFNTITQNSAGHIVFDCLAGMVRVFTSKPYKVDFLRHENNCSLSGYYYLGTLFVS